MARQISAAGLAQLAQKHGNEPIILVQVDWTPSASPKWYGDRDVETIPGRILEISDLDNVVGITLNNTSQEVSIVLDDTDGTIKAIFDSTDVHKRTVRVYQWFEGLDLDDKFLLFAGKISSPIVWDERDRTVSFTVVSQLEDKEVGFSPEEGQFEWVPAGLIGRPWPLIFGSVLDCPALQMNEAVSGTTLNGIGVISGKDQMSSMPLFNNGSDSDSSVGVSLAHLAAQKSTLWCAMDAYRSYDRGKSSEILEQINELNSQSAKIAAGVTARKKCAQWQREQQLQQMDSKGEGTSVLRVLGGEDFPQKKALTLSVGGAAFHGYFSGQNFYVGSRTWSDGDTEAQNQRDDRNETCPYALPPGGGADNDYDYKMPVPCGRGNQYFGDNCLCRRHGHIVTTDMPRASQLSRTPIAQQFWADPGAQVSIVSTEPITYIVSIVPGTVLAVKAYKDFTGERRLVDVPSEYYSVHNVNYGTISAVQIGLLRPLSSYTDQGWADDLYVTFESSVGPDVIDILIYLIEHYTDLTYDIVSFTETQLKLLQFPANFPILDRKNVVQVLQDIAYQARCALWLSNGKFYLKYLPDEPDSADTITVSDIDAERGVQVELTATEDLITKMKVRWRMRWSPGVTDREKDKSEKLMILRHNVNRYGIQEEDYLWHIYNQPDIIYKCATFWLIRKSKTWKRIRFSTFLHKLNLETFDCVTLDFSYPYVANAAVKAVVEEASYNSETNRIDFQCLVPVRAGKMEQYYWFWPSKLDPSLTWPPSDEVAAGDAGGNGEGAGATGELPIGDFEEWSEDAVIVGGQNVVFREHSDWGDSRPTDSGFQAQDVFSGSSYAEVWNSIKARLNLETFMAAPTCPSKPPPLPDGNVIDIRRTHILDTEESEGKYAKLSSLIYGINEDGALMLKTGVKFANKDHPEGEIFDFQWADEFELWAAGTAFLREDTEA